MTICAELELELFSQGEGQYQLRFRFLLPGGAAEINLGLDRQAPVTLDFSELLSLQSDPKAYGARLTRCLFADPEAAAAFDQARRLAEEAGAPLRLRLYFGADSGRLHDLLWETLQDPNRGTFLAVDETVLLSRFIPSARIVSNDAPEVDRMRLLALIASPQGKYLDPLSRINAPGELERIRQSLPYMEILPLVGEGQATHQNLLARLGGPERGCDVLYLVAHGLMANDSPAVLLEKNDGRGDLVRVNDLAADLAGLRELPLLAVLVSCQSAGASSQGNALLALGPRLAQLGIPAVLGMHGRVTFETMQRFIPAFFTELLKDGEIDRALAAARRQVGDRPDWWMPVLFSRLRSNQILKPPELARDFERLPYEPETVYIPTGPFRMGRDPGPDVPRWETPTRSLYQPGYRIGRYPVTNGEFAEFIRQTNTRVDPAAGWFGQVPHPDRLKEPVVGVSWRQARAYCAWLSQQTGRSYDLPTEAQWEKAARGPQGELYPWGNTWQENRCNPDPSRVTPIDCYPAQNEAGLYDLVGNTREWTLSLWGGQPGQPDVQYSAPSLPERCNDPNASDLVRRICRGGAAASPAEMTCTARAGFLPDKARSLGSRHGFRVVINPPRKEKQGA